MRDQTLGIDLVGQDGLEQHRYELSSEAPCEIL